MRKRKAIMLWFISEISVKWTIFPVRYYIIEKDPVVNSYISVPKDKGNFFYPSKQKSVWNSTHFSFFQVPWIALLSWQALWRRCLWVPTSLPKSALTGIRAPLSWSNLTNKLSRETKWLTEWYIVLLTHLSIFVHHVFGMCVQQIQCSWVVLVVGVSLKAMQNVMYW